MKVATITWNENTDETKIKFAKEFEDCSWIVKADILKDVLGLSFKNYNEFLRQEITRTL